MPSFKIICLLVLEKKIFKGFYHIWSWLSSWSCDLDHLYKLLFPLPKQAPHEIWLSLAKRCQRSRCLNIVNRQHRSCRMPEHGYTISSHFEPGGRTGLMVRASDSGSGDPGSILGRVGVFVSLSKRHLLPKSTGNTQE